MKKKILLLFILTSNIYNVLAEGIPNFNIEVQYDELSTHLNELNVRVKYHFNKSTVLSTQPEIILLDNWEVIGIDYEFSGEYHENDEFEVNFIIKHHYGSNLPFFPDQLYIEHFIEQETISVRTLFMVYFTPYKTTEIIGEDALRTLKRTWFAKTGKELERIEIEQSEIPESNIPDNFVPEEEWQANYQSIHIPGLAYSIPMMAIQPEELPEEPGLIDSSKTGNHVLGDGCFLSDRYKGHIRGRIVASFLREATNNLTQTLPLKGIEIEIVELSGVLNRLLGTGSTDENGFFAIWVDECRAFEGGNIELFVRIKAENVNYGIRAEKSGSIFAGVEKHEIPHTYWPYANGNTSDLNVGELIAYHESIKAVHLATLAKEYALSQPGISLPSNLEIRTASNHSYFFPDYACGIPIGWYNTFAGPTIRLESGQVFSETTTWHEFGHFLMWHLQSKCWIDFISGSFAKHSIRENSNTRIAWTEGFAHAYAQILDAHYKNWDGESGLNENRTNFENRTFLSQSNSISNGFASEFFVACTLYDLWDGSDKFQHLNNQPSFNDALNWGGETDDLSYTFSEICQVIKDGDPGSTYSNNGQIEDIQRFKELLINAASCNAQVDKLNKCFFRNQIVTDLNDASSMVNSDVVYFTRLVPYSGNANDASAFINWVTQYSYNSFQKQNYSIFNSNLLRYNLHYAAGNQIINQELNITNGGELLLNNNLAPGILNGNSSNTRPTINSTALVSVCNQKQINVGSNGILTLGDPSGNFKAELTIKQGSILRLTSNSTLRINNNSKLIIEQGAFLIFEHGASIDLNGSNAQILISGGQIEIKDNATFIFSGTGFISVNQSSNTIMGINSHFYLNGTGQNHKVLEILNNAVLSFPFGTDAIKKFTATNCNIVSFGTGKLEIASDLVLNNVKFSGALYLTTFGQYPVNIQNSTFDNVTLLANQSGGDGAPIYINNCEFNSSALNIYDKGVTIDNSTFHNYSSYAPIILENLIFPSYIKNSTFYDLGSNAIEYSGNTSAPLELDNVTIADSYNGVVATNTFIKSKCSNITSFGSPIKLFSNAKLDMSTQNGGLYRYNVIQHNFSDEGGEPLISVDTAEAVFLDEGQNEFRKEYSVNKFIGGLFNDNTTNVIAENNKWYKCTGCSNATPAGSDFELPFINTLDVTPISTSYPADPCGGGSSESFMMASTSNADLLDECNECENVKLNGEKIHKKLKKVFREIASDTLRIHTIEHINKLDSIINLTVNGNKPKVEKLKARGYANYIKLVQDYLSNTTTNQTANEYYTKAMNTTNTRLAKAISSNDTIKTKYYLVNKAYLKLNKDEFSSAISLLNNALQLASPSSYESAFLQNQICLITNEELFVNGVISSTEFDSLRLSCKIITTNSSSMRNANVASLDSYKSNILEVAISPNPANTTLGVELNNFNESLSYEYQIVDLSGRIIYKNSNKGLNKLSIDVSTIAEGAYFLKVSDGAMIKTSKFVIVR